MSRLGVIVATALGLTLATGARADEAAAQAMEGDVAYGEYLAGECVTCHQISGEYKGIPPIVGWPTDIFISILYEYRNEQRPNEVMQLISKKLTDEEMAALAAYFASRQ